MVSSLFSTTSAAVTTTLFGGFVDIMGLCDSPCPCIAGLRSSTFPARPPVPSPEGGQGISRFSRIEFPHVLYIEPEQLVCALDKLERLRGGSKPGWLDQSDFRAFLQELSRSLRGSQAGNIDRIPVRIGERTRFLDLSRITHFFSQDRLTYASADGRSYCIDWTIGELERQLGPSKFVRIHRGTLLNLDWLDELTPWLTGRLTARLKDKQHTELTVARDRVSVLKERLNL